VNLAWTVVKSPLCSLSYYEVVFNLSQDGNCKICFFILLEAADSYQLDVM
jgi:hypothetical protein